MVLLRIIDIRAMEANLSVMDTANAVMATASRATAMVFKVIPSRLAILVALFRVDILVSHLVMAATIQTIAWRCRIMPPW